MPEYPCRSAGCSATADRLRHKHYAADLNSIGETCWTCRVSAWVVWFGGPLPAMIRCDRCGQGFNLTQRLRATTMPGNRSRE